MTALPSLLGPNGKPLPLERLLAEGGEGAVFTLPNDPARLAKVYKKPRSPLEIEKLTAMPGVAKANPRLLELTAWPTAVVSHARTRQVAGFLMPRFGDCQPIQQLYNPVQRLKFFPRAGWDFQVRVAANLAAAFDEVHKAGCLVGDVNQSNALVTPKALVRLIDCDSFQVRANGKQYLCEVGVPHYTPPELQGKPLRGLVRTENHDRFGLAVLIYQLLFVGRHPYAGVYRGAGDPSFDQLIAEYRFAQGPLAHSWGMGPPPHTPHLADVPPHLAILFRRAFERGSETGTRPSPADWLSALNGLARELVECPADPGHKYWRGAAGCVWCRLAANGGPEYFYGVAGGTDRFAVDEARLQEVLRRLAAVRPLDFSYRRDRFAPASPPRPQPLPPELHEHRTFENVLWMVVGLCLTAIPFGLIRGFVAVIGALGAVVFGVWLAVLLAVSPLHREQRRRRTACRHATDELNRLEAEWGAIERRYHRTRDELGSAVRGLAADCRRLTDGYEHEVQRLAASAEAHARVRHLRLHQIADAEIPKIGAGRVQTLASHGVVTAADVDAAVILRIKGFGEGLTANLLAWKEEVLRKFRFDPMSAVSPGDLRALTGTFRGRQKQLLGRIDGRLAALDALAPQTAAALQRLTPGLREAIATYEQALADVGVKT